jgi:hypothetical protein
MAERGIVGVLGFMGLSVMEIVVGDDDEVEALSLAEGLGFGRCGCGGGRRGSVYYEGVSGVLEGRLSCCRRSGKQDCEGPRNKKSLKTVLQRPKPICLNKLNFALRVAYISLFLELERTDGGKGREGRGGLTAPWAGYWRASAMWSDDSLTGRASRALRNDLQNASSAMVTGRLL